MAHGVGARPDAGAVSGSVRSSMLIFVPGAVFASWALVQLTGWGAFWWLAPVVTFGIIPVLRPPRRFTVCPISRRRPETFEDDPLYRWPSICICRRSTSADFRLLAVGPAAVGW